MLNKREHAEFCDSYVAFSGSIWVSWGDKTDFFILAQVRHDTVERPANSFRISLSDGKVCTTFGIGFQPFWNV